MDVCLDSDIQACKSCQNAHCRRVADHTVRLIQVATSLKSYVILQQQNQSNVVRNDQVSNANSAALRADYASLKRQVEVGLAYQREARQLRTELEFHKDTIRNYQKLLEDGNQLREELRSELQQARKSASIARASLEQERQKSFRSPMITPSQRLDSSSQLVSVLREQNEKLSATARSLLKKEVELKEKLKRIEGYVEEEILRLTQSGRDAVYSGPWFMGLIGLLDMECPSDLEYLLRTPRTSKKRPVACKTKHAPPSTRPGPSALESVLGELSEVEDETLHPTAPKSKRSRPKSSTSSSTSSDGFVDVSDVPQGAQSVTPPVEKTPAKRMRTEVVVTKGSPSVQTRPSSRQVTGEGKTLRSDDRSRPLSDSNLSTTSPTRMATRSTRASKRTSNTSISDPKATLTTPLTVAPDQSQEEPLSTSASELVSSSSSVSRIPVAKEPDPPIVDLDEAFETPRLEPGHLASRFSSPIPRSPPSETVVGLIAATTTDEVASPQPKNSSKGVTGKVPSPPSPQSCVQENLTPAKSPRHSPSPQPSTINPPSPPTRMPCTSEEASTCTTDIGNSHPEGVDFEKSTPSETKRVPLSTPVSRKSPRKTTRISDLPSTERVRTLPSSRRKSRALQSLPRSLVDVVGAKFDAKVTSWLDELTSCQPPPPAPTVKPQDVQGYKTEVSPTPAPPASPLPKPSIPQGSVVSMGSGLVNIATASPFSILDLIALLSGKRGLLQESTLCRLPPSQVCDSLLTALASTPPCDISVLPEPVVRTVEYLKVTGGPPSDFTSWFRIRNHKQKARRSPPKSPLQVFWLAQTAFLACGESSSGDLLFKLAVFLTSGGYKPSAAPVSCLLAAARPQLSPVSDLSAVYRFLVWEEALECSPEARPIVDRLGPAETPSVTSLRKFVSPLVDKLCYGKRKDAPSPASPEEMADTARALRLLLSAHGFTEPGVKGGIQVGLLGWLLKVRLQNWVNQLLKSEAEDDTTLPLLLRVTSLSIDIILLAVQLDLKQSSSNSTAKNVSVRQKALMASAERVFEVLLPMLAKTESKVFYMVIRCLLRLVPCLSDEQIALLREALLNISLETASIMPPTVVPSILPPPTESLINQTLSRLRIVDNRSLIQSLKRFFSPPL